MTHIYCQLNKIFRCAWEFGHLPKMALFNPFDRGTLWETIWWFQIWRQTDVSGTLKHWGILARHYFWQGRQRIQHWPYSPIMRECPYLSLDFPLWWLGFTRRRLVIFVNQHSAIMLAQGLPTWISPHKPWRKMGQIPWSNVTTTYSSQKWLKLKGKSAGNLHIWS